MEFFKVTEFHFFQLCKVFFAWRPKDKVKPTYCMCVLREVNAVNAYNRLQNR